MIVKEIITMLTQDELDNIMEKINLTQFKDEVKEKNEKRGRKPKDIANHYFEILEYKSYGNEKNDFQGWVDDVLNGAARLSTGNSKTSPEMIFALLKGLPFLSTREIKSWLNRKRSVLGGHVIDDDSYCRWLLSVCHSAIKSLDYHQEGGSELFKDGLDSFNWKADNEAWLEEKKKLDSNGAYLK